MKSLATPEFVKALSQPIFNWFEKFEEAKLDVGISYPSGGPLHVIFFYIRLFRYSCIFAFVIAVAYATIEFGKFYAIEVIVDSIGSGLRDEWINLVSTIAAFIVIFGLISPFMWFVHSLLVQQTLSATVRSTVQKALHGNIVQQNLREFNGRLSGQTTMRLHQAANAVRTGINLVVDQIPTGLIQFVGTAVMVGSITPAMAVPVVLWLFSNVILVAWLIPRYSKSVQSIVSTASATSGNLSDIYNNILTVKMYDQNAKYDPIISTAIDQQASAHRGLCRYNTALSCVIQFINAWLLISIVLIGLRSIDSGTITTGEFAAAVALVLRLTTSVDWFVGVGQAIVEAYGALNDAEPIFAMRPDAGKNKEFNIESPNIKFENVTFGYESGAPLLNGIDLTIGPGERVGIIGESGSGKSTIVSLLAGLFQPTTGRILIDGVDLTTIDGDTLRRHLAVVTQDTALLNRSVEDNILYGTSNRTHSDIQKVLIQARAENFVLGLEDSQGRKGLESYVGEKGMKLSGGERQRIVVSRALLRGAKILILDEATSALDTATEAAVIEGLGELESDLVVLSITHRMSTLKKFDRILKLKGGKLEVQASSGD